MTLLAARVDWVVSGRGPPAPPPQRTPAMTTATTRHRLTTTELATLCVANWADVGDQRQEQHPEDGHTMILDPESAPVVMVTLDRGDVLVLDHTFGVPYLWQHWSARGLRDGENQHWNTAWRDAMAMADRIRQVGSLNLDKWTYLHGCYDSEAYFADGWDDYDRSLD